MNGSNMTDREAIAELVALKDLKVRIESLSYGGFQGKVTSSGGMEWEDRHAECEKLKAEYDRRKPLAWAAARARLALPESMFSSKQNVKRLADEYADISSIRTVADYGTTHDKEMVRDAMKRLHAAIDALAAPQINAPALPVAYVPIHPRNGPLWAMTTDTPDPQRLPSYPLMQLYADPINAPALPVGHKLLRDTTHDERSWHEDAGHENGNYSTACWHCLRQFQGHKRRVICRACATIDQINAPAGTPALPRESDSNALGHETHRSGEVPQAPTP